MNKTWKTILQNGWLHISWCPFAAPRSQIRVIDFFYQVTYY